jgi:hypothetical protein
MLHHLRFGRLALCVSALFLAASAQAADLEKISKLLPDETETVMSINIRQILDSAVVKKYGMDKLKDALDNQGDVKDYLKDMGLDPFKDIDSIIIGSAGSSDTDKGLVIINGRFNPEKVEAKVKELSDDKSDAIKVDKIGKHTVFEISVPNQPQSMFACVLSKNMILAASSKGTLEDAIKKEAGDKTTKLKNKQLGEVVAKMDDKQSFWMVMPASALPPDIGNSNEEVKKILDNVEIITAGATLTDKLVIKAGITAKDAESAKSIKNKIRGGLDFVKGMLAFNEQYAPLAEAIGKIKATANDKTISIEGELSAEDLEQLFKLGDQ